MNQLIGNNLILVIKCPERNKTYNIETEKATLVEELCQELGDALGCSEQQEIRLFRDEVELDRRQSFGQLGIQKGCQLEAKIRANDQQKKLNVQQKSNQQSVQGVINLSILYIETNKVYAFRIKPEDQIDSIIPKLKQQIGGNIEGIWFNYNGRTLLNDKKFSDYDIMHDVQLQAFSLRKGG